MSVHPARTRASELSAEDLAALDPGIRRTVVLLRSWGFDTRDSGDGRSKADWAAGRVNWVAPPSVTMQVEPEALVSEARRLREALHHEGIDVPEQGPDEGALAIQASYDPGSDVAVLALYGVDDAALSPAPACQSTRAGEPDCSALATHRDARGILWCAKHADEVRRLNHAEAPPEFIEPATTRPS